MLLAKRCLQYINITAGEACLGQHDAIIWRVTEFSQKVAIIYFFCRSRELRKNKQIGFGLFSLNDRSFWECIFWTNLSPFVAFKRFNDQRNEKTTVFLIFLFGFNRHSIVSVNKMGTFFSVFQYEKENKNNKPLFSNKNFLLTLLLFNSNKCMGVCSKETFRKPL